MPEIGAMERGQNIGKRTGSTYKWLACLECGRERWVYFNSKQKPSERCRKCVAKTPSAREAHSKMQSQRIGIANHMWKGGKIVDSRGYKQIKLMPDDFFIPMANKNRYVLVHRLVMAKKLGRNLHPFEIVHHKNGIKDDNRIENLQLIGNDRHNQITILERKIQLLEMQINQLKQENKSLRKKLQSI